MRVRLTSETWEGSDIAGDPKCVVRKNSQVSQSVSQTKNPPTVEFPSLSIRLSIPYLRVGGKEEVLTVRSLHRLGV